MNGGNPKYLSIPKKIQYNIRLPKPLLDKLNVYAELTGKTTTDVVIGALEDLMYGKILYNDYLPNMKGITIRIPMQHNEKKDFYNFNLIENDDGMITATELYNDVYGYTAVSEPYDILKIPNNLDKFSEHIGYNSMIDSFGSKGNHSGIEFVIFPDVAMESDDVMDALYCFYFEVKSFKLTKIFLIDYVVAINKAKETENNILKSKLVLCVKELQQLNDELDNNYLGDDYNTMENFEFKTLKNIADRYNTGNIVELGENEIDELIYAELKDKPDFIDELIDDVISDKVDKIVDEKLSIIKQLVVSGESKDRILTAIENTDVKTNK